MKYPCSRLMLLVVAACLSGSCGLGGAYCQKTLAPKSSFFLKKGDRVVFLGDSITEQKIYTTIIQNYTKGMHPDLEAQFVNAGLSGDYAKQALMRLKRDVLDVSPTVVVVSFGMNDICVGSVDEFLVHERGLIHRLKSAGVRICLLTTTCVSEKRQNPAWPQRANRKLEEFAETTKRLGAEEDVPVIDLFHPLLRQEGFYEESRPDQTLLPDGVHPNEAGHMVMAMEILKSWGFICEQ
jgi:lysophospholipase L1-like esterase